MPSRILYVDDEPDIREVAAMAIGLDPEFEVRTCESGEDALAIVPVWKPDLILLDVMMPSMDGPATLGALRAGVVGSDVPIVFITARTQAQEVERFRRLGAVGVIAKPFDPMTLAETVRGYLRT